MLNFVYMTEADRREAASIDRRRALEEERKKRIFDPKAKYSIDYKALDEQIAQKKKAEQEEKERDDQFLKQQQQYQLICKQLEDKEQEERRRLALEVNNFRQHFQKKEDRREFDLEDPRNYNLPARIYDDDPRCGPSSIQKFEGEDLYSKERAAIQRDQLKSWLDQQIMEKEAAEKERLDSEHAYKAALLARDARAIELDNLEKDCKKKLETYMSQFNRALADEKAIKRKEKERQEARDDLAHKYNVMMSDMMMENTDCTSALGPTRKVAGAFKGMSPEQKAAYVAEQKRQIQEIRDRKKEEKNLEKAYDEYAAGIQATLSALNQEDARKRREIEQQIKEENLALSKQQKSHQEFLKKVVYTNKPTAAYYDQFNKTAR